MKFDLNLTILIIILLLNVWSIFVKSTCGETVETFKYNTTNNTNSSKKIKEIHSKIIYLEKIIEQIREFVIRVPNSFYEINKKLDRIV